MTEACVIAIIILVILLDPFRFPKLLKQLKIALAYKSKYVASHYFLSPTMNKDRVDQTVNFPPLNWMSTKTDHKNKIVTASVLGIFGSKKSHYYSIGGIEGTSFKKKKVAQNIDLIDLHYSKPSSFENIVWHEDHPGAEIPPGIDVIRLCDVVNATLLQHSPICAITVAYKNHVIIEKYNDGVQKDNRLLGWSMTKTIGNALLGNLVMHGEINIHDVTGISHWSGKNDLRGLITIDDLLRMQSGIKWVEDYETVSDVTKMLYLEEDHYNYAVHCPLENGTPNELPRRYNYSSGTSNILSGLIRAKMGSQKEYLEYPYQALFGPLGMKSALVELDSTGQYVLSSYGWANARDWTRFGLLYLYKGNWFGHQVFSEDWLDYTRTPGPHSNGTYGAHVWLNSNNEEGGQLFSSLPPDAFLEKGFGGQQIVVIPSRDLVITVLSGIMNSESVPSFFNNLYANILNCISPD